MMMANQDAPVMLAAAPFRVVPFGRDCLGNITGWRVMRSGWAHTGNPHRRDGMNYLEEVKGQFVGNLYRAGSFEEAERKAAALAATLNA
jgi:hypothetical protein